MMILSLAFIGLTIICLALLAQFIFTATEKSDLQAAVKNRVKIGMFGTFVLWSLFVSVWSSVGKMSSFQFFPFNIIPILIIPMIGILFFSFSKTMQPIIGRLTQTQLIALQSFRIVVEILIWRLFVLDKVPVQMSFEGKNWDILTGLSALLIALLVHKKKIGNNLLVIWNLLGLALLVNIVTITFLSMPSPFRIFLNEPSAIVVTQFPVSLLPGLLVPIAYGLHFLSLRKIAIDKPNK